ncbi:MAG: hypothetical protein IJT94_12525 [Oscillibacter sp.]|nr:hypothetical protein [Oscillibacter sp.]
MSAVVLEALNHLFRGLTTFILVVWWIPAAFLLAALLIYIAVSVIRELRK